MYAGNNYRFYVCFYYQYPATKFKKKLFSIYFKQIYIDFQFTRIFLIMFNIYSTTDTNITQYNTFLYTLANSSMKKLKQVFCREKYTNYYWYGIDNNINNNLRYINF